MSLPQTKDKPQFVSDTPLEDRSLDIFGRQSFARSILEIATDVPSTDSVRIGIYGDWGSGKTSILQLLANEAYGSGYRVVYFEPWSARSPNALWSAFIEALKSELEPSSNKQKWRKRAKNGTGTLVGGARDLSGELGPFAPLVKVGADFAEKKLTGDAKTVAKLLAKTSTSRVLVLVDELDRTRPELVFELLLSIRNIFDLPGFSFVLAFDASAVRAALGRVSDSWGTSLRFLEKIVEYPRFIPQLTSEQVALAAQSLRNRYCQWLPSAYLEGVAHLMPGNPRRLKLLFRELANVGRQVPRFWPDELDFRAILLTNLLRAHGAGLAEGFWTSPRIISALEQEWLRAHVPDSRGSTASQFDQEVTQLLQTCGLTADPDAETIAMTVRAMAGYGLNLTTLRKMSEVGSRPPLLTAREVDGLSALPLDAIEGTFSNIAARSGCMRSEVVSAAYSGGVRAWSRYIELAADSETAEDLHNHATAGGRIVEFLQRIVDGAAFLTWSPSDSTFSGVLDIAFRWAHFRNVPVYQGLRNRERALLESIAHVVAGDLMKLAKQLSTREGDIHSPEATALCGHLLPIVELRASNALLALFDLPGAIDGAMSPPSGADVQPILLGRGSYFWRYKREEFIAKASQRVPERAGNFIEFVQRMAHAADNGNAYVERGEARALVTDQDVVTAAWAAALARVLQPRLQGDLIRVRAELERILGGPLPVPTWWPA